MNRDIDHDVLYAQIIETLEKNEHDSGSKTIVQTVLNACDHLANDINETTHLPLLLALGMRKEKALRELQIIKTMLSRTTLEARLSQELGDPTHGGTYPNLSWRPLGVLLHIAAGNVDALPAFSVIEGLLAGNVNLLKLPSGDDGLSGLLLDTLVEYAPSLKPYIHIFDTPSTDIEGMKQLAELADAIVLWGGDEAVSAVRALARPNTKIIEWGHKISFAYVSGFDLTRMAAEEECDNRLVNELRGIAYNMLDTSQLFCNSCQGIYVDTDQMEVLYVFAERFHKILEEVASEMDLPELPVGICAQKALEQHTEMLESAFMEKRVFLSGVRSVIAYPDQRLMLSYQFGNCWVKRLPRNEVLMTLKPYKNHLQTMALVCMDDDKRILSDLFLKTGIVRITRGELMSVAEAGMPHDGEFPLRRMSKLVSVE